MENFIFKKADILLPEDDQVKAKGVHIFSLCKIKNTKAKNLETILDNVRIKREPLIKASLLVEAQNLCARAREDWKSVEFFTKELITIQKLLTDLWEEYNFYLKQLHHDFLVNQLVVENITTTVGRAVLARRLAGNNVYSANVSHTALGTSNTSPNVANVQLGTEVYRKALSSGNYSNNITYLESFFTAVETSGTYEEYGNFIDGSATINSGQLFNRFTQSITKSTIETLNVASTITISDA